MVKTGLKRTDRKQFKPIQLVEQEGGCVICTSHEPNIDGYHRVYNGVNATPRCIFLHRSTWEVIHGPVPEGYELDHLCRNRRCCNPSHLQLLTRSQHKTKTNLERYAVRIAAIITDIQSGLNTKCIAEKHGVSSHTVTRYKRSLTK